MLLRITSRRQTLYSVTTGDDMLVLSKDMIPSVAMLCLGNEGIIVSCFVLMYVVHPADAWQGMSI